MKQIFLFTITFIFFSSLVLAQDLIIKTNLDTIKSTVTEVTDDMVYYRMWKQTFGPGYSIPKSNVYKIKFRLGHEITINDKLISKKESTPVPLTYRSGFFRAIIYQGDKKLNNTDTERLLKEYPYAHYRYEKGKNINAIGITVGTISALALGIQGVILASGGNKNTALLVIGSAGLLSGIIIAVTGNNIMKQSIAIYDSENEKKQAYYLKLGLTENGIGLCLTH